jgi:hypothetical protein
MKCSKCGAELEGKFCTNCGAPAPTKPVCSNCGEELEGKFCTKCGTPAPTSEEAQPTNPAPISEETQPTNPAPTEPEQTNAPVEPVDYQNSYTSEQTPQQPDFNQSQPQNVYQENPNPQPVQYGTSYGQNFTNQPANGYAGQQFTNQPAKKSMSGGKIAAIIISIILGLIIILGVIIGVVACSIVNSVSNAVSDYGYSNLSSDLSNAISDIDSYIEDYTYDSSDYYSSSSDTEEYYDEATKLYYEKSDKYDGWKITDYNNYEDYSTAKITVTVPSQIDGKDVVEIETLHVYDNDSTDNGYIKIIIPGTVKVIDSYSMSFCEDINEVVIEDGCTTIEEDAFTGCTDLKKVTVPASVTSMDGCNIGFDCDDNYDDVAMGKDFTLYCDKGSTAESYAKSNKLNYEAK